MRLEGKVCEKNKTMHPVGAFVPPPEGPQLNSVFPSSKSKDSIQLQQDSVQ